MLYQLLLTSDLGHGAIIEGVPVSPAMMMVKGMPGDVVRMEEVRVSNADEPNTSGYPVAGETKY